jgi:anti-sigma regulatory factor (Ser/Thr protein kinase)
MTDERRFANAPASVTQARHFAIAAIGSLPPEAADAVALMVSELATNSVKHAESQFTVRVDRNAEQVHVAVVDTGPGQPAVRSPSPHEHTGRGLQIVRALADDWGVTPLRDGPGKVVWFTVRVEPR